MLSLQVLPFTLMLWTIKAIEYPNAFCNSFYCSKQPWIEDDKTDLSDDTLSELDKSGHSKFIDNTKNNSKEILLHSQNNKKDSVMLLIDRLRRTSGLTGGQICPELNTGCPNLTQYPHCNMYRITNVCPWKYFNNREAVCVTKQPCFNIDKSHPNLQCKEFYWAFENGTRLPIVCLAVKPETVMSTSLLG